MTYEWSDEGEVKGTCASCGEERLVKWTYDPFMLDVYDERTKDAPWCFFCWQTRRDDI